jgi:hypothetical protein
MYVEINKSIGYGKTAITEIIAWNMYARGTQKRKSLSQFCFLVPNPIYIDYTECFTVSETVLQACNKTDSTLWNCADRRRIATHKLKSPSYYVATI